MTDIDQTNTNGIYTYKSPLNKNIGTAVGVVGSGASLVSSSGLIKNKAVNSGLSGLANGVSAGMALGPLGAVAGGVIGGIIGYVQGENQKNEETQLLKEQQKIELDNKNRQLQYEANNQIKNASSNLNSMNMNNFVQQGVTSSVKSIQSMIVPSAGGTGLINNRLI